MLVVYGQDDAWQDSQTHLLKTVMQNQFASARPLGPA
jgi:hypothetical protein